MAAEPMFATNFHAEFWKHLYRQMLGGPGSALTHKNGVNGFVCDVLYALRNAMPRFEGRVVAGYLTSTTFNRIPHDDLFVNWPLEASFMAPDVRRYGKFLMALQQSGVLRVVQAKRMSTFNCAHLHIVVTHATALERIKDLTKNDIVGLTGLPNAC